MIVWREDRDLEAPNGHFGGRLLRHDDDHGAVVDPVLPALLTRLRRVEVRKLGFPGWSKPLEPELRPFLDFELNNYGDPDVDPVFGWHTKDLERELVERMNDLFDAPPGDRWGYVTTGGSEGILHGLWQARSLYPTATVYYSDAAHGSVAKAVQLLDRNGVAIPVDDRGEMDYRSLQQALLSRRAGRPAIVVATIGTTLTEAVDDVTRIRQVLRQAGVRHAYLHADAALSGVPLALQGRAACTLGVGGVDSISVSGHKFLGVPWPCGVLLTRASHRDRIGRSAAEYRADTPTTTTYTGSPDPTVGASRNGHSALVMWYRWTSLGADGLRRLAETGTQIAAYAEHKLAAIGWDAWRSHPLARTVVIKTPPERLLERWPLATVAGHSHVVCTPGVTTSQIDAFVADLRAVTLSPHGSSAPPAALGPSAVA